MADTPIREQFTGSINGEQVQLYKITDGQYLALMRCVQAFQADLSFAAMNETLMLAEDIVLSLIAMDEAWIGKLRRSLAMGEVTLVQIVNEVMSQTQDSLQAEAIVAPRRRPGRPRKNV